MDTESKKRRSLIKEKIKVGMLWGNTLLSSDGWHFIQVSWSLEERIENSDFAAITDESSEDKCLWRRRRSTMIELLTQ